MKRVFGEVRLPDLRHMTAAEALSNAYDAWDRANRRLQEAKRRNRGIREATMHELRASRRVRALDRILC